MYLTSSREDNGFFSLGTTEGERAEGISTLVLVGSEKIVQSFMTSLLQEPLSAASRDQQKKIMSS